MTVRDFPGDPVVKTPRFHCKGHGFDAWWGNQDPTCCVVQQKKKKERKRKENDCEFRVFPGGTVVKNPPANVGDMGSSPGPGRSHMPWSN